MSQCAKTAGGDESLMCGIAGAFGRTALGHDPLVNSLLTAMHHRGPDARGVSSGGWHVLGHNRLAINDLSPSGEQPFKSASGTVACMYNGELYNHCDLRSAFN